MYHKVIQYEVRFEWDPAKEETNKRKHGVSFEEAKQALCSELGFLLREDLSNNENRYVYIGMCKKLNLLVVVAAYSEGETTRIISARKANKRERKLYEAPL